MEKANNKRNPYKVPDHYFEDFSARMQRKITEITPLPANEPPGKTKTIFLHLRPILSFAAMVAVIYLCTYLVVQPRIQSEAAKLQAAADNERQKAEWLAAVLSDDDYEDLMDGVSLDDLYADEYPDESDQ